jgi:creatinine amidohydrolase
MQLSDEAWPEVGPHLEESSLALVPLGSTEQHGPHLPEGTDHLIAEAFARAAGDRGDYLCTPTVTIGVSSHHRQFPGTMWVSPPVFRDYVESFTRNLAYHGVDRVVYVNAHGGNVEHLQEVGRRLHDDGTAFAVEWMWNDSVTDLVESLFGTTGPHGGPKETSLIMHLHPELVHDDRLEAARDGGIPDPEALREDGDVAVAGSRVFYDSVDISGNGVAGDQTDATPEKGERLFEAATEQLLTLCEWLADRPDETPGPHPRVTDYPE